MRHLLVLTALILLTACAAVSGATPEQFSVVSFTWNIDGPNLRTVGELKNDGQSAAIPKLRVTARDAEGKVVDVATWEQDAEQGVRPGATLPFTMGLRGTGVADVKLEIIAARRAAP
jgi:hypothetical protein